MSRLSRAEKGLMVVFVLLFVGIIIGRGPRVRQDSMSIDVVPTSTLLPPKFLKAAALDLRGGVAAVKWLDTLTYYGGQRSLKRPIHFQWMYRALSGIVILNPYHLDAYEFVNSALGIISGKPQYAARLMYFGSSYRTADWRMMFGLGYHLGVSFDHKDRAADYWKICALLPGAPHYIGQLASMMAYSQNDIERTVLYLEHLLSVENPDETQIIGIRAMLQTFRQIQALQEILDQHLASSGESSVSIWSLPGALQVAPTKRDIFGGTFVIDRETQRVRSTSKELQLGNPSKLSNKKLPEAFFSWEYGRDPMKPLRLGDT